MSSSIRFWPGNRREDATAASYSATDLVRIQRELGQMARYAIDMGGDVELFEIAMRIPPWERLRALTPEELKRLRMNTAANPFGPVPPGSQSTSIDPAPGQPATPAPVPLRTGAASGSASIAPAPKETRWAMADKPGLPVLVRLHPLTIEGESVGTFELSFTCGETASSYAVTYVEHRRLRDAKLEPVTKVVLFIAGERIVFTVVSSDRAAPQADLVTTARGTMPSFSLRRFGEGGAKSITVATATKADTQTSIAVGNTGFTQAFPLLAVPCAQRSS